MHMYVDSLKVCARLTWKSVNTFKNCISNQKARVTRLSVFSPFGIFFLYKVFYYQSSPNFLAVFSVKKLCTSHCMSYPSISN
jgi:hypothetical protein